MNYFYNSRSPDIELDAKAQENHRIDSLNLLLYTLLLTLAVLTIWLFKHRRFTFLHESGLSVFYGLIVGALIRYTTSVSTTVSHLEVIPKDTRIIHPSVPPDELYLWFPYKTENHTYSYRFHGDVTGIKNNEFDKKATFDPEIFFNIILPPIIFHAGYSLKKKYFFKNFGAILTYAILGTAISSFVVGFSLYGCLQLMPMNLKNSFSFLDVLYFGALISPTDPVTILAIFKDLRVDVNLYSLVFGDSVLNDAVALVLSGSIQDYERHYSHSESSFEIGTLLIVVRDFVSIFFMSLTTGALFGCITALMTKFTRLKEFPLLETAIFVLMSYSSFLVAEVADLTGVVAVLFCGIFQAHYTYNNLSLETRRNTQSLFELLNFLAENFIFSYIGVSMFTFPRHNFDVAFITSGFILKACALLGRALNIYPLSFLLNLGKKSKIPLNFQHVLFLGGLRGAISFALAIRNTLSEARQTMLTTTSLIVIVTVIIQGGATIPLLNLLKIPTGVEEEIETLPQPGNCTGESTQNLGENNDETYLARKWKNFDTLYVKPLLTHSYPTLIDSLPRSLNTVARILTTTEQLTKGFQDNTRCNSIYGQIVSLQESKKKFLPKENAEEKERLRNSSTMESSNFM